MSGTPRDDIPSLTGLRFVAAFSVAIAHGADLTLRFAHPSDTVYWMQQIAGLGMTLFFVLSGFVIHYNYRIAVTQGGVNGVGGFIWARFSRLYPLYALVILIDIVLGRQLYQFVTATGDELYDVLHALPYFLTFTQSWVYVPFARESLIYQIGSNSSLTWSISTEWFFYLAYPVVAFFVMRVRRPSRAGFAAALWCVLWIAFVLGVFLNLGHINAWAVQRYGSMADIAHDPQNSFFRWLMYFSPYLRIGEFILGCLIAQLYILLQDKPPTALERSVGKALLALGIVGVPVMIYLMYAGPWAPIRMLNYNFGMAPSAAVILFCAARYKTAISRVLNARPIVALGEASYSMYLFHFLIFNIASSFIGGAFPETPASIVYLFGKFLFLLGLIMLVSLGFHAYVEVPARQWLRELWRERSRRPTRIAACSIFACPAIAAILLFVGIPSASSGTDLSITHGIRITLATYGVNCGARPGNATREIGQVCNGKDRCHYVVDVGTLGDPAPGCEKNFVVSYQCPPAAKELTERVPAEAGLGKPVDLSCTPGATADAAPVPPKPAAQGPKPAAENADTPAPTTGILVGSATYGGNCGAKAGNVTADVQMTCDGSDACSYKVDTQRLGDPAPKCGKAFAVEYTCAPDRHPLKVEIPGEAGFGKIADLRCPRSGAAAQPPAATAKPGIRILSATYGANCGARIGDASADVKKSCDGSPNCDYKVDVGKLGDPAPRCSKSFYVKYRCGGETTARFAFARPEAGFGSTVQLSCPKT